MLIGGNYWWVFQHILCVDKCSWLLCLLTDIFSVELVDDCLYNWNMKLYKWVIQWQCLLLGTCISTNHISSFVNIMRGFYSQSWSRQSVVWWHEEAQDGWECRPLAIPFSIWWQVSLHSSLCTPGQASGEWWLCPGRRCYLYGAAHTPGTVPATMLETLL